MPGDIPPRPSASPAGRQAPGATVQCPISCPPMEIEINDTPATTDDLVQLACARPAARHLIPCRIRLRSPAAQASTVVLTNPDGRLRFGASDLTTTLSVPADGSWVAFQISGERGSAALNDAVIEAHCGTATCGVVTSKPVTVFWYDQEKTNLTVGGRYILAGGQYTTTGGNAINHSVEARIRPAGVNCAAPQVAEVRVGIMQNDITTGIGGETIWSNPTIAWAAGTAAGTSVTVAAAIRQTQSLPVVCNDVAPTVAPLYDQPGKAETLDPNSLKPPLGCAGGAAATSFDTPSSPAPATFTVPAVTATGANVGVVTYRLTKVRVIGRFLSWTTLFNTRTQDFCVHRQRGWALSPDSSAAGDQKATADAADAAPTTTPVLAPTANTVVNLPANSSTGPAGPATVAFTR